jgi:ribosomal-protein-alanine N-acetyltransferase
MLNYRLATSSDLSCIYTIETDAGFAQWSEAQLQDSLKLHTVFVVEQSAALIGFAIFNAVLDEAELLNIVIAPTQQNKGIGKALLMHCLQKLQQQGIKKCFLEVGANNSNAVHLYQRIGFTQIALRQNYYQYKNNAEDALVLQLQLEGELCKS